MCAILFKITSRPPLLNPLQPKSKVLQVSLSTILAMQFQELYPQCCHSDEEHRAISGRVLHAGFGGDDETSWLCQRLFYPD